MAPERSERWRVAHKDTAWHEHLAWHKDNPCAPHISYLASPAPLGSGGTTKGEPEAGHGQRVPPFLCLSFCHQHRAGSVPRVPAGERVNAAACHPSLSPSCHPRAPQALPTHPTVPRCVQAEGHRGTAGHGGRPDRWGTGCRGVTHRWRRGQTDGCWDRMTEVGVVPDSHGVPPVGKNQGTGSPPRPAPGPAKPDTPHGPKATKPRDSPARGSQPPKIHGEQRDPLLPHTGPGGLRASSPRQGN